MDALIEYFRQASAFQPTWVDIGLLLITIVAGVVAWLTAILQIQESRRTAKINNSFEHIAIQTRDHDLIRMFEEFRLARRKLRDGHKGSFGLEQVEEREITHHGKALIAEDILTKVFNYYEATAIGVDKSALDEDIIKSWWRKSYVWDFIDFAYFVFQKRDRDEAPKMFIEYEKMALRWANDEETRLIENARKKAEMQRV